MKFSRYFNTLSIAALTASMSLSMASCTDNEFTYDDKWLDGEEQAQDPENPGEENEDPEAPTYSFSLLSKNVKINPEQRFQVLEGIGASDCWLPNIIGEHWTGNRQELATLLFSQEMKDGSPVGIGLSTWRFNLGAGTEELGDNSGIDADNANNRAPSFVTATSTASNMSYDWNKCPGQRYFMQQAKTMGVENFVLFSNSPLVQFTKNGKGKSNAGANANIKDDYYDDFAVYMATVAEYFVGEGYNISHISPVNEPQYNWNGSNQEGSGWKNAQVARLARELDKALADKGISTRISLGEAGAWDCLYQGDASRQNIIDAFFNPESEAFVGDLSRLDNICAHSYYTDGNWATMRTVRQQAADAAAKYGVNLWQTEWSMLVNGPNHYGDILDKGTPWTIAQWMSAVIHNDFTVAGVTSWSFWTAMSVERYSQQDRFMLINCVPAGGNYSNDFTQEGRIEAFPTLWVLGNYSRFIRPGYQRIGLDMISNDEVFGDAWISPDGKQIVAVYTNRVADRGLKLNMSYGGLGSEVAAIHTYTSSAEKCLQGKEWDIRFPVVCDPSSVTTVVIDLK